MPPVSLHPLFREDSRSALPGIVIDRGLIDRLSASFNALRPAAGDLAAAFYRRLFEKAPHVRDMFTQPIEVQQQKLIASLETIVQFLTDPPAQRAFLRDLGKRHANYGARPEHYNLVIETFLEAIEEVTGGLLDPMVKSEWRMVMRLVSDAMIDGAIQSSPTNKTG
ncbi:MAG: hypothetical protein KF902_06435 [Phycisphaeraceae bacterium]|nr:hypothetical protein [Phycisphaeraceae bacterium]MCW5769168.1 hypothetical protein [Phycisphaeraceae bacterium]